MSIKKFQVFDVNLDTFVDELASRLTDNSKKIEKLLLQERKSYVNFVREIEMLDERLGHFFTPLSHINSVQNSPKTEKIYADSLPLITKYNTQISQNIKIYSAYKQILKDEIDSLDSVQMRVLTLAIEAFELSGAHLDESRKKRLQQINLRLSELSNTFSQNLLDATSSFEYIVKNSADVETIAKSDLEPLVCDEGWKFTLMMPSYIAYMTYGSNAKIREDLYRAYVTRAPENSAIIDEILELRAEMANLLGFDNYALYSLKTKAAKSPQEVFDFLDRLKSSSKAKAIDEYRELQDFANAELKSSDITYYSQKLKEKKCAIDDEAYRVYFEKSSVVDGMFDFLKQLFGIEFKRADCEQPYSESVDTYDLYVNNTLKARLYLDLEARKNKRGGAWMHNWQSHCVDEDGVTQLASAFVVCNFPPSSSSSPSLLRHDDVVTLFHEMGHAIHHLLCDVDECSVSGVNGVEWDAVEFPSQFLESFAYEPTVLKLFAKHCESKEPLGDDMINALVRAKNFASASSVLRQVEFSLFDFNLHVEKKPDVQAVLDHIREETSVLKPPSYNKFQNGFAHIFGGGYAAGYYSYQYALMLSADCYERVVEEGIFDTEVGQKYLNAILSSGGSRSMSELFEQMMGRECDPDALLRVCDIV